MVSELLYSVHAQPGLAVAGSHTYDDILLIRSA